MSASPSATMAMSSSAMAGMSSTVSSSTSMATSDMTMAILALLKLDDSWIRKYSHRDVKVDDAGLVTTPATSVQAWRLSTCALRYPGFCDPRTGLRLVGIPTLAVSQVSC